jgi:maltooligosyltrehalose trehalohydrolase
LARAFRDGFIYAGQYSTFRQKRHGTSTHDLHGEHFVVFSQDHDQIGNRMLADRYSQTMSLEKLKLAAAAVLLSPYVPMLFMGEEYGEPAPFQYFVSHDDKGLIEAVRKGREEEFARFQWAHKLPDPQAEETFLRSKMNWELQNSGKHKIIRDFYRELLDLRARIPALNDLSKNDQEVVAFADQNTLFIRRWSGESQACIAFHFGETAVDVDVPIPEGRWKRLLDYADKMPETSGVRAGEYLNSSGVARLKLEPWQFCVFVKTTGNNV